MGLKFKENPLIWFWLFLSAIITGGATAVSSWFGLFVANEVGMRVSKPNFCELGIIALSGAITATVTYLMKSPLPALEERDTIFIVKPPDVIVKPPEVDIDKPKDE